MEFKFVIFIVSAIVLVPFVYGAPIITQVCALPPDPGYSGSGTCGALTTNPSTGEVQRTCCWTERVHVPGKILAQEVNYCQTCNTDGVCKAKVKQLSPSDNIPEQEGGVLQRPTDNSTFPTKRLGTLEQSQSPIPNPNEGASAAWPYRQSDDEVIIAPETAGPNIGSDTGPGHPLDKTNVPAGLNANTDSSVKENGTNSSSRDSGKGFP